MTPSTEVLPEQGAGVDPVTFINVFEIDRDE